MAKSIYTDGVWAVMHFNSSVEAYRYARELGPISCECCYCHQKLAPELPFSTDCSVLGTCSYCGKSIEYINISLSRNVASYFDVRGGTLYGSPLAVGGVMHIILPRMHTEFDALLHGLSQGQPMEVSWWEQRYLLVDFVSRVINAVGERFRERIRELRERNALSVYTRNMTALAQSFGDFGRVVSPRCIKYSSALMSSLDIMVAKAAEELEGYLVERFRAPLSDDDLHEIGSSLLEICSEFVKLNWATALESVGKQGVVDNVPADGSGEPQVVFYGKRLTMKRAPMAMKPGEEPPLIASLMSLVAPCPLGRFVERTKQVMNCGRGLRIILELAPSALFCPHCGMVRKLGNTLTAE